MRLLQQQHPERSQNESRMSANAINKLGVPLQDDPELQDGIELRKHDPQKLSTPYNTPCPAQGVTAQDWNGRDDSNNPMNWPLQKKVAHITPVALLCFVVTAGSSMITPGIPNIQQHFGVSRESSILSLSVFVLGLGIGPAIAAPISEWLGRSIVYKVTTPVYILFTLGAGFSETFPGLLACRLLAGMAGGPCLAVGAGTSSDLFPVHQRATPASFFIMTPFLGPCFGPVVGGVAVYFKGYRWTQWCTVFLTLVPLVAILPMHETYKKAILRKRARRLGVAASAAAHPPPVQNLKQLLTTTLFRPVRMLCVEPIVLLYSLYNSFTFGTQFAFFTAYPYVFERVYSFNTWQCGLTFLGIGTGVVLAAITAVLVDRTVYQKQHAQAIREGRNTVHPEQRLYIGMGGSFGVTIGYISPHLADYLELQELMIACSLFWFAWTARPDVHWIVPILAGVPFAWGNLTIFLSASWYLIDVYGPLNGASAMAANGLMRYTTSAAFPLFTLQVRVPS